MAPSNITLGDFKQIASLQGPDYKFYFRSRDNEFGIVKEELTEDDTVLPVEGDRIVAWVLSNTINQSALFNVENVSQQSSTFESPQSSRPSPSQREFLYTPSTTAPSATVSQIHVHLVLDSRDYLGLTLVGQIDELSSSDRGIYVGRISPSSIIDRDGRVMVGDRIIGVNGFNLLGLCNDDAVATFKRCINQRGAISLILERRAGLGSSIFLNRDQSNSSLSQSRVGGRPEYRDSMSDIPVPDTHADPLTIRPVSFTNPRTARSLPRSITPRSIYHTTGSENTMTYDVSPLSLNSRSIYEATTPPSTRHLDVTLHCRRHDIHTIFTTLRNNPTGLEVKDREWLRVIIKDAFLGSDLIRWLSRNVYGFNSRREVKTYANQMLSLGLIKNPMTSGSFSERCFYTFC